MESLLDTCLVMGHLLYGRSSMYYKLCKRMWITENKTPQCLTYCCVFIGWTIECTIEWPKGYYCCAVEWSSFLICVRMRGIYILATHFDSVMSHFHTCTQKHCVHRRLRLSNFSMAFPHILQVLHFHILQVYVKAFEYRVLHLVAMKKWAVIELICSVL